MSAKDDFLRLQAEALDEANELVGNPFIYKGVTYTGIITEVEFTADLVTGGQLQGLGAVIVVPKSQLSTKPKVGETVKVNGSFLRVEKVKEDAVSLEITIISAAT